MNTSLKTTRQLAAACLITTSALFALAQQSSIAAAARPRPTPPPSISTVPAPTNLVVQQAEAVRMIVEVDPGSGFTVEGQYVSGPLQTSGFLGFPVSIGFVNTGGPIWITNLVGGSEYVVRFRRTYFFNSQTGVGTSVTSAWKEFRFRTPTLAASRPSTPHISITSLTSTRLLANWSPSVDNNTTTTGMQYVYTLNEGPRVSTPSIAYSFGTTGLSISRPPAGSRIVVYAVDQAGIESLPSNTIIVP